MHITESYACILKIFFVLCLLPLIYSGMCSTPMLSKYVTSLFNACKAIGLVPILAYLLRCITNVPFFIFRTDYYVNKHH